MRQLWIKPLTLFSMGNFSPTPFKGLVVVDAISSSIAGSSQSFDFESFVLGSSNQLAYKAALCIGDGSAPVYNPLFIYASAGLGKTHLLHAVEKARQRANLSARYVTAGEFIRQFVSAIQNDSTEQFRKNFCGLDVLLLDDVQCFGGKPQSQDEIFHIFNCLHQAGKQMVIASDRPPQALALLEDRLRSRFEWGLVADIQPPDLETRISILKDKAQRMGIPIDDDVLERIARSGHCDVGKLISQLVQAEDPLSSPGRHHPQKRRPYRSD